MKKLTSHMLYLESLKIAELNVLKVYWCRSNEFFWICFIYLWQNTTVASYGIETKGCSNRLTVSREFSSTIELSKVSFDSNSNQLNNLDNAISVFPRSSSYLIWIY